MDRSIYHSKYNSYLERYKQTDNHSTYHSLKEIIHSVNDNKLFVFRGRDPTSNVIVALIMAILFGAGFIAIYIIMQDELAFVFTIGLSLLLCEPFLIGVIIFYVMLRDRYVVIGPEGILTTRGGNRFYKWADIHKIEGEMKAFMTQPSAKRIVMEFISNTGSRLGKIKFTEMGSDQIKIPDVDRRMKIPLHQAIMAHICFIYHDKKTEIIGPDTEFITQYFNAPDLYELSFRENLKNQDTDSNEVLSAKFDYSGVLVALFAPRIMGLVSDSDMLIYKRLVNDDVYLNTIQ